MFIFLIVSFCGAVVPAMTGPVAHAISLTNLVPKKLRALKIKKCQHLGIPPLCDKMSVGEKSAKKSAKILSGKKKCLPLPPNQKLPERWVSG